MNKKAEKTLSDAGKFPLESCREKLARRYGQDAVALSGPCEGSSLADCVCTQLKQRWSAVESRFAGHQGKIEKLAMKIGESFMQPDDTSKCVEDLMKSGKFNKDAATGIASYMKAYAMPNAMHDEFAGAMSQVEQEYAGMGMGGGPAMNTASPMGGGMPSMSMSADQGMDDPMGGGMDAPMAGGMDNPMGGGDDMIDVSLDDPMGGGDVGPMDGMGEPPMGGDMGMGGGDEVTISLPTEVVDELLNAIQGVGGKGVGTDDMGMMDGDVMDDGTEIVNDEEDVPGEPSDLQDEGQIVTNEDAEEGSKDDEVEELPFESKGEDKKDEGKSDAEASAKPVQKKTAQSVLKLGPEMSINNTGPNQIGPHKDKELGDAKEKKVEDPKCVEDNMKPTGYDASKGKVQDGKTMGKESPLEDKGYGTVSNGKPMKNEEKFDAVKPEVPAGGGRMGNEPEIEVNMSTKGTVIATITPKGILIQTPDDKRYFAPCSVKNDQAFVDKINAGIAKIPFTGNGRAFASACKKLVRQAEESGGVDGVTMTNTSEQEASKFSNTGEKKPEEGGAIGTGSGAAPKQDDIPTTNTSKLEDSKFTNDGKKEPEKEAASSKKPVVADSKAEALALASKVTDPALKALLEKFADKKVEEPKPVEDNMKTMGHDASNGKVQDGKTMGKEEKFDPKQPGTVQDGKTMGKEEKFDAIKPEVPAGGGRMGEEPEQEIDLATKGTIIAGNQPQNRMAEEIATIQNNAQVREARVIAAGVYVADLLRHGEITEAEYAQELDKYAKMPVQAIQALALSTRKARERVANRAQVAGIVEGKAQGALGIPVVITASNNDKETLTSRLIANMKMTRDLDALEEKK